MNFSLFFICHISRSQTLPGSTGAMQFAIEALHSFKMFSQWLNTDRKNELNLCCLWPPMLHRGANLWEVNRKQCHHSFSLELSANTDFYPRFRSSSAAGGDTCGLRLQLLSLLLTCLLWADSLLLCTRTGAQKKESFNSPLIVACF